MTALEEILVAIYGYKNAHAGAMPRRVTMSNALSVAMQAEANFVRYVEPEEQLTNGVIVCIGGMDRIVCVPTQTERVLCHGE